MMSDNVSVWVETERAVFSHLCLGLADMFLVEQELSVQVADVYRV